MTAWTELLRRRVVGERTAARIASVMMYVFGLATMLGGIRKLTRLGLNEKEFFFGILLVVNLSMLVMLAGVAMEFVARLTPREPPVR